MSRAIEYLKQQESASPSRWKENAQWRKDNERWLKYARFITMKTMQAMDEQGVTQKMLAERMGCTQQYVSNLLKGSSNMTLETIAKIEDALEIDIVNSALTFVSGYSNLTQGRSQYLSEPEPEPYGGNGCV